MKNQISLRSAALIAGIAILIMAIAAPIADLYIYPRLNIPGDPAGTFKNITAHESLFRAGIFGYLVTFLCDILAAWALYIFLKPVNENLSLLTAWFRLIYSVIALIALLNLFTVLRLVNSPDYLSVFGADQLYAEVKLSLGAFRNGWNFGILFFGIHLLLLGFLVFRSVYVPRIIGILIFIAGVGYLANGLKPYLFPDLNLDFAKFTFFGELIFMFWLLIRGARLKIPAT